jgi:hypothetical protein
MFRLRLSLACVVVAGPSLVFLSGCIGVSAKPASAGAGAQVAICRAGAQPAADGIIDDFEDGNTQLTAAAGRDGYWYPSKDNSGSTMEPDPFAPAEGGADGSGLALHFFGKTVSGDPAQAWGAAAGLRWMNQADTPYDASKYAGITFKARVDEKATRNMRVKIGDVNTHPDGHVCKACFNHFGKDFKLTPKWQQYTVLFTEAQQLPDWGDPRPPAITPGKLYSLDFAIAPAQPNYDVWIDDVQFIECK